MYDIYGCPYLSVISVVIFDELTLCDSFFQSLEWFSTKTYWWEKGPVGGFAGATPFLSVGLQGLGIVRDLGFS